MLFYGDVEEVETVGSKQQAIGSHLERMAALPPGSARHGALVAAFIGASELFQGLIDAEFQAHGIDTLSPPHALAMECLALLGRSLVQSWQSGSSEAVLSASFWDKLHGFDPGQTIRTKQAEGYAFYALYPESYVEAALRSGLGPNTRVIGIRSIGTGLSAVVAAALKAPPAVTLRPGGHPFHREVKAASDLTEHLTQDSAAAFAIVDEGPGLSGSSFGAVADWLEDAGIPRERIHFFPSHAGQLGPQASDRHRERWSNASRHFVGMDELLFDDRRRHLTRWIQDLTGPLQGSLEDISGGQWRASRYQEVEHWPAANIQQEKRKFLARTNEAAWLVKFAGLGESGIKKLAAARQLHEAGFASEVLGYSNGFLIEQWHEHAQSLDQHPVSRDRLMKHIGAYLGFRSLHLPAEPNQGASLAALRHMALYNTQQSLGEQASSALEQHLPGTDTLEHQIRRVRTDNRMQPWEWIVSGDKLLKTDALDHCAAHDLVGCQDITWDIAGAAVEFSLSSSEIEQLCSAIEAERGHPISPALLAFMTPCYLAFQIGAQTMAATALEGSAEEPRLRREARRYEALLQRYLESHRGPNLHEEQDKVPAG